MCTASATRVETGKKLARPVRRCLQYTDGRALADLTGRRGEDGRGRPCVRPNNQAATAKASGSPPIRWLRERPPAPDSPPLGSCTATNGGAIGTLSCCRARKEDRHWHSGTTAQRSAARVNNCVRKKVLCARRGRGRARARAQVALFVYHTRQGRQEDRTQHNTQTDVRTRR